MKTIKGLFLALIAFIPLIVLGANGTAPGQNGKVPLEITSWTVVRTTPTSAKVMWTTSSPSQGSILVDFEFDSVGFIDQKVASRHEVTVTGLTPGMSTQGMIGSYSEKYGAASPIFVTIPSDNL